MSFTLPTNEEKYQYVHSQFERIARGYDLTNDAISFGMHRLWKAKAVKILLNSGASNGNSQEPRHFLDVCCGTGDLALRIASSLDKSDKVTGLDFSNQMLEVARARTATASSGASLDWIEGDAQNLPFEDDSFDGAIISFGLRNLTNINLGLAEMRRVVKPGGLVINLDLGRPRGPVFAPLFSFFFNSVVPFIGSILQQDRKAYTYLPQSMSTYPEPEQITERFELVGLTDIRHLPLAGGSVALHHGRV